MSQDKKRCIIDRFEGDHAVIEYGRKTFDLPRELLSHELKEGDVINFKISLDESETINRKKAIETLTQSLFKD